MLQTIQSTFFTGALILLSLCIIACLMAAIKGPSLGDRMVAANMTGTLTIIAICILAWHLDEGWLVDVALFNAMCPALFSRRGGSDKDLYRKLPVWFRRG